MNVEQLKQAGDFVWRHRFWFAQGLAVILALVVLPTGSTMLKGKIKAEESRLDGVYNNISRFSGGGPHPNDRWTSAAQEKQELLAKLVDAEWEKKYIEQEQLMIWPEGDVSKTFFGRPFLAPLSDRTNLFLQQYRPMFPAFRQKIFGEISVLDFRDGELKGNVEVAWDQIPTPDLTRMPDSREAWMAQEQMWILGAIFRAISKTNAQADGWEDAPIRRLESVVFGQAALGPRGQDILSRQGGKLKAPRFPEGVPQPSGSSSALGTDLKIINERYLEATDQFRTFPVAIHMLVDHRRIPEILSVFETADLNFTVLEVSTSIPDKEVKIPDALTKAGVIALQGGRDNAIFNTWKMELRGAFRLYEMPPKLLEERKSQPNAPGMPGMPTASTP